MPMTFATLQGRLSISSNPDNRTATIFYRPRIPAGGVSRKQAAMLDPVAIATNPDVAEIIAHLGGESSGAAGSASAGRGLDFNYGEILSILSSLTQNRQITAYAGGEKLPASFILQELPRVQDQILDAPPIPEQGRPQKDEGGRVGLAK